jgi:ABC-type spermidine/putrescine transport system permease subunit II
VRIHGHAFSASISVIIIVILWAPLAMTALNAVNANELLTGWDGATLQWFREALENPDARSGLAATLLIAVVTSVLSVGVAVTGALWWRRASARGRRLFDFLTYLRIIMPEVVFAVALFLLFTKVGVPLGTVAVILGHTVWSSAYATLVVQSRVIGLDPSLEDAAADLGAAPVGIFWRVTVPNLLPAIAAAALLTFTFSFDNLVTSFFMSGTETSTLPVVVLSMIRFRISPEVNAIGIAVMATTVTTMSILFILLSRGIVFGRRSALPGPIAVEQPTASGASTAKRDS